MDIVSGLIIAGICVLCVLPILFGSYRSFDKSAKDIEGRDPETALALRKARRDIDRGRGYYGP